jgi:hypothetical protein
LGELVVFRTASRPFGLIGLALPTLFASLCLSFYS